VLPDSLGEGREGAASPAIDVETLVIVGIVSFPVTAVAAEAHGVDFILTHLRNIPRHIRAARGRAGRALARFLKSPALDDAFCFGGLALVGGGLWLVSPTAGLVTVGLAFFALSGAAGKIRSRL